MIIFYLFSSIYVVIFVSYAFRCYLKGNLFTIDLLILFSFVILFVVAPISYKHKGIMEDASFNLLMFATFLAMITAQLLTKSVVRSSLKNKYVLKQPALNIVGYLYLAYLTVQIGLIAKTGFLNIFTRDRAYEFFEGYWSGTSFFGFASKVLIPCFMIFLYERMKQRKFIGYFGYAILLLQLTILSRYRSPIFVLVGQGLLFYHFHIRRIRIRHVIFVFIFFFLLMGYGSYMRRGIYHVKLSPKALYMTSMRGLSTSFDFHDIYREIIGGKMQIEAGKNWYYHNIISFIPRRLWSEKPATSFNARMTEKYFGYKIGTNPGSFVHTFTVFGEGMSQFGVFGVILYGILIVIIYKYFFAFLSKFEGSEIILFGYLLSIPMIMRGALDSVIIPMLVTIFTFLLLRWPLYEVRKKQLDNSIVREIVKG